MRTVVVISILVIASGAYAADWWVELSGQVGLMKDSEPSDRVDISNPAVNERWFGLPNVSSALGGGLVIGGSVDDGKKLFGLTVDYLSGSDSGNTAVVDTTLGGGDIDVDTSAIAVGAFIAGRLPWFSSDSIESVIGGGLGVIRYSGEVKLAYIYPLIDPETGDIILDPRSESASSDQMTLFINLFLMESFKISDTLDIVGTFGVRGMPLSDYDIDTESMSGSHQPEFVGAYLKLGIRYDI